MEGKIIQSIDGKLEAFCKYFQKLYAAEVVEEDFVKEFLNEIEIPGLGEEHSCLLEHPTEKGEIAEAIKLLKPNTAPCNDGFTVEFY